MGPLLAIFAHPDDETFTTAGVLAAAAERGLSVTVVSATRGELGESSISGLTGPEQLGVVREGELRTAMAALGVGDLRFLGYRDSGMEGSPAAAHPQAFVQAPLMAAAAEVATLIRATQPHTVITFGPEGIYGHPDHLQMHRVALQAIDVAANHALHDASTAPWRVSALYYATFPREELLAMFAAAADQLAGMSEQARANLGTPRDQITHEIDVSPWADRKRSAIAAHRTQTGDGGPLSALQAEFIAKQLVREHFVRAPLPWMVDQEQNDFLSFLAAPKDPA